jgi:hypothetical protein
VLDKSGNVYVAGAGDSEIPTTEGAYSNSNKKGDSTIYVTKFNSDLSKIIASTFIFGGGGTNSANGLAIDSLGNVYVAGTAFSSEVPVTTGAFDTKKNDKGEIDVYICKLNNSLTKLLAATYFGGDEPDYCYTMTLDTLGNVYIAGETHSDDDDSFPTTANAFAKTYNGSSSDGFIAKLSGDLTQLLSSTYIGGGGGNSWVYEKVTAIALDSSGNLYATGYTASEEFPTTTGAYMVDGGHNYADAFICKLNNDLSKVIASTYFGGEKTEYSFAILISPSGSVYIAGETYSDDDESFPTTKNAYNTTYSGGSGGASDAFIAKFDADLSAPKPEVSASGTIYGRIAENENIKGKTVTLYNEKEETVNKAITNDEGVFILTYAVNIEDKTIFTIKTVINGNELTAEIPIFKLKERIYPVELKSTSETTCTSPELNINTGWNLIGWCGKSLPPSEVSALNNIKTLWEWTGTSWQIWSPDSNIVSFINSYSIKSIDKLTAGEGFWINK